MVGQGPLRSLADKPAGLPADPGFLTRFDREARHAAQLNHPRLVTVFDSGIDGQTPFIVMELVAGLTVRQVLDQAGMLPAGEAVRIAAAVCEALEVAHAAGLAHRDITPANIVLAGGQVKVLDFGIARAEGATGVTGTAGVLGTAAYLSPEQASGRPAGPQADLYALDLAGRPQPAVVTQRHRSSGACATCRIGVAASAGSVSDGSMQNCRVLLIMRLVRRDGRDGGTGWAARPSVSPAPGQRCVGPHTEHPHMARSRWHPRSRVRRA